MKCPICEKDVELQKKQVGVDEQGAPIFHQYAICRNCKKQWNLDKQRARKAAAGQASSERKAQPEAASGKASSEGKAQPEAASGKASSERKIQPKAVSGKAVSEKKESQKPAVAAAEDRTKKNQVSEETVSESREKQKTAAESTAEKKPGRKPADAEPPAERKMIRKAAAADSSTEGKPGRKPVPEGQTSEKKAGKKRVSAEISSRGKQSKAPESVAPLPEKRPGRRPASEEPADEKKVRRRPVAENVSDKKPDSDKPAEKKQMPVSSDKVARASSAGQQRRPAAKKGEAARVQQRYGNIPPDKVRAKKEHAVRKGYEDMLSTDPNYKPPKKKKAIPENEEMSSAKRQRPASVKQRPHTKAELEDDYEENEDMEYGEVKARFRILRIIFGIISIVAAGFFAYGGFFTGLNGIASGGSASAGTAFIAYGICMLISGLILIILQNRNSILAFILPMVAYFGGAAFTFLNRKDDPMLLYCSVAGVVLGIIFLILGIISRNSGDDSEDYDDPFEDDYE